MSENNHQKRLDDLLREVMSSNQYYDPMLADPQTADPTLSSEEFETLNQLEQSPMMELLAQLWAAPSKTDRRVIRQFEVAIVDCEGYLSSFAGDVHKCEGNITFCSFAARRVNRKVYFVGVMQVSVPESQELRLDESIRQLQELFGHDETVFEDVDRTLCLRDLATQDYLEDSRLEEALPSTEPSDVRYRLFTIDDTGILQKLLLEIYCKGGSITYCTFRRSSPMGSVPYFNGEVGVKLGEGSLAELEERLVKTCEKEQWDLLEQVAA